jgi:transketolase
MRLATEWCATESQGPVYMRLGKAGEPDLTAKAVDPFKIGKIRCIQKGSDIALLSYGITVDMAHSVAEQLSSTGKSVSIYSCHTIKPLDKDSVQNILESHDQVAVIEEHVPHGGLGSRVKEIAWDKMAKCRLDCFSLKDEFIHFYGNHQELLERHGLHPTLIANHINR